MSPYYNTARLEEAVNATQGRSLVIPGADHSLEITGQPAASLQALDTSGVPPMSHPREGSALREDEPHASLDRRTAFEAAPDAAEGLFRVPRVIGG